MKDEHGLAIISAVCRKRNSKFISLFSWLKKRRTRKLDFEIRLVHSYVISAKMSSTFNTRLLGTYVVKVAQNDKKVAQKVKNNSKWKKNCRAPYERPQLEPDSCQIIVSRARRFSCLGPSGAEVVF